LEALGINLGYLFVQIFNFAILFVVLRAWVYKPILGLLERRRVAIAQGLEDARVAAEARANAEKEAQAIIAEAQAQAAQRVRESTERAETAAREITVQAEQDAAKHREAALADAAQERDRILADVRGQIVTLAMAAAQKLVKDGLDEQRQRALIQEFFSGVKSGRITALEGVSMNGGGGSVEVTSALPLTPEEQDTIKRDILSKLGSQATVTFRVDPSILGGLIIRIGDKVVDASVAGQMENLRSGLR
jgi:F-type H+-transporting ATPase subunit b